MNKTGSNQILALSVDVEEYFHAANLAEVCPIRSWNSLPSTVEDCTKQILDLLDEFEHKATFFVLGYCAKRYPDIVKDIVKRGHELASHGLAHKIAYLQNRKQFKQDITRSKKLLEDISGIRVLGYRAPNFSIRDQNLWAYEVIKEAGFVYDSSLYPVSHPRYGNIERSLVPEIRQTENGGLLILPVAVYKKNILFKDIRIPIAGGAYWRVLPRFFLETAFNSLLKSSLHTPITYLHPWELDTNQPHFASLPFFNKFKHYYGISTFKLKLAKILKGFKFATIKDSYHHLLNETK